MLTFGQELERKLSQTERKLEECNIIKVNKDFNQKYTLNIVKMPIQG